MGWQRGFLLEARGENPFLSLFQLLQAARVPWLVATPHSNLCVCHHLGGPSGGYWAHWTIQKTLPSQDLLLNHISKVPFAV